MTCIRCHLCSWSRTCCFQMFVQQGGRRWMVSFHWTAPRCKPQGCSYSCSMEFLRKQYTSFWKIFFDQYVVPLIQTWCPIPIDIVFCTDVTIRDLVAFVPVPCASFTFLKKEKNLLFSSPSSFSNVARWTVILPENVFRSFLFSF